MFYAGKCRCSGCFSYFIQSLSRIVLKNVIFCGISNTESGGVHVPGGKTANNFYAFCRSARHPRICYFGGSGVFTRGMSYGQEIRSLPGEYTADKGG